MMDFRVTAELIRGGTVIEEMFSSRKEADAFVEGLMQEGGVLDGLDVGALTVAVQELCNGTWTTVSRRLVRP